MILQTSAFLSGTYDEAESAASFQEALKAWRNSDTSKQPAHSASLYFIAAFLLNVHNTLVWGRYFKAVLFIQLSSIEKPPFYDALPLTEHTVVFTFIITSCQTN